MKLPRYIIYLFIFVVLLFFSNNIFSLEIISPENGEYINSSSFTLNLGDDALCDNYQIFCDGLLCASSTTENSFLIDSSLNQGDIDIQAKCIENLVNGTNLHSTPVFTYNIDTIYPSVNISKIVNKTIYIGTFNISTSSSELVKIKVIRNSNVIYNSNSYVTSLSDSFSLVNGENELVFTFEDRAGNIVNKVYNVYSVSKDIDVKFDKNYYSEGDYVKLTITLPTKDDANVVLKRGTSKLINQDFSSNDVIRVFKNLEYSGDYDVIVTYQIKTDIEYERIKEIEFEVFDDSFECKINSVDFVRPNEEVEFSSQTNMDNCSFTWTFDDTNYEGEDFEYFFIYEGKYNIKLNCQCDGVSKDSYKNLIVSDKSRVEFSITNEKGYPLNNVIISIDEKEYLAKDGSYSTFLEKGDHVLKIKKVGYLSYENYSFLVTEVKEDLDIVLYKQEDLDDEFEFKSFEFNVNQKEKYSSLNINFDLESYELLDRCILFEYIDDKPIPVLSTKNLNLMYIMSHIQDTKYKLNCYSSYGSIIEKSFEVYVDEPISQKEVNEKIVSELNYSEEQKKFLTKIGINIDKVVEEIRGADTSRDALELFNNLPNFDMRKINLKSNFDKEFVSRTVSFFNRLSLPILDSKNLNYENYFQKNSLINSILDRADFFNYQVYLITFYKNKTNKNISDTKTYIEINNRAPLILEDPKNYTLQGDYTKKEDYIIVNYDLFLTSSGIKSLDELKLEGYLIPNANNNISFKQILFVIGIIILLLVTLFFIFHKKIMFFLTNKINLKKAKPIEGEIKHPKNVFSQKKESNQKINKKKKFSYTNPNEQNVNYHHQNNRNNQNNIHQDNYFESKKESKNEISDKLGENLEFLKRNLKKDYSVVKNGVKDEVNKFMKKDFNKKSENPYKNLDEVFNTNKNKGNINEVLDENFKKSNLNKESQFDYEDINELNQDLKEKHYKNELHKLNKSSTNKIKKGEEENSSENIFNKKDDFKSNVVNISNSSESSNQSKRKSIVDNFINRAKEILDNQENNPKKYYYKYVDLKEEIKSNKLEDDKLNELLFEIEIYFSNYFINKK